MDQQQLPIRVSKRGREVEIIPGLWIGSLASLRYLAIDEDCQSLSSQRCTWAVISVLDSEKLLQLANAFLEPLKESSLCAKHIVWKLPDKPSSAFLSEKLQSILILLDEALKQQRNVLVHCAMGVSRSAALCAACLITRKKLSLEEAMDIIRLARPEVFPNMGFIASLRSLERCDGDIEQAQKRMERNVVE